MSTRSFRRLILMAASTLLAAPALTWAGHQVFNNGAVGGVSIDTAGVLREPDVKAKEMLLAALQRRIKKPEGDLNRPVEMRMVSLKGLHAAIRDAMTTNLGALPEEVRFLGGLQRIQYIIVDDATQDVILAGPGEGWRVDENAVVVGSISGRPVLHLDDLLVAFRNAAAARDGGISVSIDPTEEGRRQFSALLSKVPNGRSPQQLEPALKQAFGPQQISILGVPADSHFARVLVAADYRMKRYAMHLEPAPVAGLSSYIDMMKGSSSVHANPRWWLACNYEPLARSEDGLAWELRGPGVKCLTEDEVVDQDGTVKASGRKDVHAQRWADAFTENYEELSTKDAVFGELRNLMDLSVVAALITRENLLAKAGCELPLLTSSDSELSVHAWNAPKTVEPQCSFVLSKKGWIVTASGGVEIDSWTVTEKAEISDQVEAARTKAMTATGDSWWWN